MAYADNYNAKPPRHCIDAQRTPGEQAAEAATPVVSSTPVVATTLVTRRAPPDVRLPCMVYAAVGAFADTDTEAVRQAMADMRKAPGVLSVLSYPRGSVEGAPSCEAGLAVITRGYWLARQLLARLMDECGMPAGAPAVDGGAEAPAPLGAVTGGLTASSAACTVQFYNGHLRVWMATSDPARLRAAAARIAGCAVADVDLRVLGSEDPPQGLAVLVPAIALARELQSAPVQLIVAYDLAPGAAPVSAVLDAVAPPEAPAEEPEGAVAMAA
jgi:hypothetical protein